MRGTDELGGGAATGQTGLGTVCRRIVLDRGWQLARGAAGQFAAATDIPESMWAPAEVPGTAAAATADAALDYDADDWWFRVRFPADPVTDGEEVRIVLDGVATLFEVELNGERLFAGTSMYVPCDLDVSAVLTRENTLAIVCRALAPRLARPRRPRARWRTQLVAAGNLRFFRTMLLGRAPGFAPGPAVVGPYREVALERRTGVILDRVRLRPRVRGAEGVIRVTARLRVIDGARQPDTVRIQVARAGSGTTAAITHCRVIPAGEGTAMIDGEVHVAAAERWWPHTHGAPALYDVVIGDESRELHRARTGFRALELTRPLDAEGLGLAVNGVPIFMRGAVWTPADLRRPAADPTALRAALEPMVAAGMNMVRVAGIGAYESPAFYDLCDELGLCVWQDFMFANLDYPEGDDTFMSEVRDEVEQVLAGLAGRPSLAVLCGGSEVAQQPAMLGLDVAPSQGSLYGELLPELIASAGADVPYVPSTPWGGDFPFRLARGVANYYGVGAYRRPLTDARRADVRFAAECLAFANVPDDDALGELGDGRIPAPHTPAWKGGVPRDRGAGWDFDDVRDHYLRTEFGVDPVALRSVDPHRYRDVSRQVSGEVMAETFGEWRRAGSTCSGALVLWWQDHRPGAGWGVLDHRGMPKVVYHHLRRVLAPVAVWSTDEGLGGLIAHVANDRAVALTASLRVSLYRGDQCVEQASTPIEVPPASVVSHDVETVLGRFVDASWAYRFGPAGHDLVVISLEAQHDGRRDLISQSFRFPTSRPLLARSAAEMELTAELRHGSDGRPVLAVRSRGLVYGAQVVLPGRETTDNAFCVEPGHERLVGVTGCARDADSPGALSALNLRGSIPITDSRDA